MKKFVLFFIAGLGLMLPFMVNAEVQEVWDKAMNLSNSLSSSLFEVSDGVILIQYEGGGSSDNLLKKYDFDGKKIWHKTNDYGNNFAVMDDKIFIWSGSRIYILDKDGNVIKDYKSSSLSAFSNELYNCNSLSKWEDYYVLYNNNGNTSMIFLFDKNGNFIKSERTNDLLNISSSYYSSYILASSVDDSGVTNIFYWNNSDSYKLYFRVINSDNEIVLEKEFSLSKRVDLYGFKGMDIIEDKFVLYGSIIFVYDKTSDSSSILNAHVFDMKKNGNYLYTYEAIEAKPYLYVYSTNVVKYDSNLKVVSTETLPLMFSSTVLNSSNSSNFAKLKQRSVFLSNSDASVDVIVLNSPFGNNGSTSDAFSNVYTKDSDDIVYGLSRYTTSANSSDSSESSNDSDTNSDNQEVLIKNPDTSSMSVILFFVILIGSVIILSYSVFKKKRVNMMQ